MTTNATIRRLTIGFAPYAWGLRIENTEKVYFDAFIDSLKINVPASGRKWDPMSKQWMFKQSYFELVKHLLTRYSLTFTIDTGNTDHARNDGTTGHRQLTDKERAAAELFLLPDAPECVINAVYRALSKQYHPDAGGNIEQMQRLNSAVEVLRK